MSIVREVWPATVKATDDGQPLRPLFKRDERRIARWWLGGVASAGAVFFTHPLDLMKVLLQTQREGNLKMIQSFRDIIKNQGFFALYRGASASITRQLSYTLVRFAIYDTGKQTTNTVYGRTAWAMIAGFIGGFVGVPSDVVNVRMQNDVKLPPEKRRNYKNIFNGLARIYTEEGPKALFSGWGPAVTRSVFLTVGGNVGYDTIRAYLLSTGKFNDNVSLHLLSSLGSAICALTVTQPIDVVKTRRMNARPGEFNNVWHVVVDIVKTGPMGFYKGSIPSLIRLGPHMIILFAFYEQLRLYFGAYPKHLQTE